MLANMTPKERVLTALRRKKPDKVPKDLSWGLSPGALAKFKKATGHEDYLDYFGVEFGPSHITSPSQGDQGYCPQKPG